MGKRGCIHIYTGEGKGKTTAALGLAVRALGAGWRVYIGQFLKARPYSEQRILRRFPSRITIEQFGRGCLIKGDAQPRDILLAQRGLERSREIMREGKFEMVILDEIIVALNLGLLQAEQIKGFLRGRPVSMELVLTGRGAPAWLERMADLVTQMREEKHYYKKGVKARRGIEF